MSLALKKLHKEAIDNKNQVARPGIFKKWTKGDFTF